MPEVPKMNSPSPEMDLDLPKAKDLPKASELPSISWTTALLGSPDFFVRVLQSDIDRVAAILARSSFIPHNRDVQAA